MRRIASLLLVALAVPATLVPVMAAEVWRWTDESGVIRYSDTPVPGAERIMLDAPPPPAGGAVQYSPPAQPPPPPPPEISSYAECVVLAPGNDQTFNAVNTVTVSLQITPGLKPDHGVQVIFDGNPYAAWPARMLTFKIENVERGTHTLAAQVVDARKKVLCNGPSITFHVRQPSVLNPNRNKPKPKTKP